MARYKWSSRSQVDMPSLNSKPMSSRINAASFENKLLIVKINSAIA